MLNKIQEMMEKKIDGWNEWSEEVKEEHGWIGFIGVWILFGIVWTAQIIGLLLVGFGFGIQFKEKLEKILKK